MSEVPSGLPPPPHRRLRARHPPGPSPPSGEHAGGSGRPVALALAVVFVAVAVVLGFVGRSRQSAASDARETADELDAERRDLENRGEDAEARQDEIRRLAEQIGTSGYAAIDANSAFTASEDAITAAENAAIDQANAGNVAGARAMFENEVGAAIGDADADFAAAGGDQRLRGRCGPAPGAARWTVKTRQRSPRRHRAPPAGRGCW